MDSCGTQTYALPTKGELLFIYEKRGLLDEFKQRTDKLPVNGKIIIVYRVFF